MNKVGENCFIPEGRYGPSREKNTFLLKKPLHVLIKDRGKDCGGPEGRYGPIGGLN